MKNYYEILEIDKNASQDVIDKAYKVLVKKYHPDLQTTPEAKAKCEEKIKEINEAYDTISNESLRREYDEKFKQKSQPVQPVQQTQQAQSQAQPQVHYYTQKVQQPQHSEPSQQAKQVEYERQYRDAINKAYHDAYIQDLKRRGYKIKYKKTFNDYIRSLIALLITIGIILLVLQLPFVKNYINDLYANNPVIRSIIDTLSNVFK